MLVCYRSFLLQNYLVIIKNTCFSDKLALGKKIEDSDTPTLNQVSIFDGAMIENYRNHTVAATGRD